MERVSADSFAKRTTLPGLKPAARPDHLPVQQGMGLPGRALQAATIYAPHARRRGRRQRHAVPRRQGAQVAQRKQRGREGALGRARRAQPEAQPGAPASERGRGEGKVVTRRSERPHASQKEVGPSKGMFTINFPRLRH